MPPVVAILITYIIWGAAPPVFKFALEGIPPFTLAFIRFFGAALLLLPFTLKHWQKVSFSQFRDIALGAFFGITINISFFFIGLEYSQSINVHIIGSLGALVAYFLAILILHEKPHPQIMKGMIIALAGVFIIVLMPLLHVGQTGVSGKNSVFFEIIGNICFIISMLGGVFHAIFNKRVLKKVNSYMVTFIGFFVSSLTFLPLMIRELQAWSFQQVTFNGWVGILYGVVLCSAVAYFLFSYGMAKMTVQEVGILGYISPIIAVLVAIPLVHEYPNIYFAAGSVLVFTGIMISQRNPHYSKTTKKLHGEKH